MAYYKNRRDANEPEIVATLEAYGLGVEQVGPFDLSVWCSFTPACVYWAEVKLPERKNHASKFTTAQTKLMDKYPGCVTVLYTTQDADAWARELRGQG